MDSLAESRRTYRTLVVEDDAGTAELERRTLERAGHDVQVASTVEDALRILNEGQISAVLLDYRLPDSEGWPVLEAGHAARPPVPVIMVTAQGDERVAAEAVRRGAADYVIKRGDFLKRIATAVENAVRVHEAEDALHYLRELHATILECVDANLVLLDSRGEIVTVNENWRRFADAQGLRSPNYCVGQNYLEVLARSIEDKAEGAQRVFDGLNAVLRGDSPRFSHEYPCHTKDGQHWYCMVATPVQKQLVRGAVVAHQDITERVLAEKEQGRKEELVRNVLASVGEGIAAIDANGEVIAWNEAATEITGVPQPKTLQEFYSALTILRRDGSAELPFKDYPINRALEGESTHECDLLLLRNGSEKVYIAVNAKPLLDDHGRITGAVATFRDTTESLLHQHELLRLASAVEQATLGVYITNFDGVIEYVNPALERLTGYSRGELRGANVASFTFNDADAGRYKGIWDTVRSGSVWTGRAANRRKNGEQYMVEVTIGPMRDDDGNIAHFVVTHRDCGEQARLEDQLRQSQKMEAVGQLAGGVAHDFNNQLAVISGFSELILAELDADSPLHEDMQHILRAAQSAAGLTRQLLAFSRRQVLQPQIISLNKVVEPLENMLQRLIPENIELELQLAPSLETVSVDPGQIEQVVVNLVVNARDAMPDGGRVSITTRNVEIADSGSVGPEMIPVGNYVMLSVSDTGTGISSEILPSIFEPFFTTKEKGKGTGLGLSTVYGIVKQSGGHILPSSGPGRGTQIDIFLPQVFEIDRNKRPAPSPAGHGVTGARVLVIEDDHNIKTLVERILDEAGCAASSVDSGEAALQALEQAAEPFDVVVSDVVLTDSTGPRIVEQIRERLPDVRAIFMSGYTSDFLDLENAMHGSDEFIEKPFSRSALVDTLGRVLATIP